MSPLGSTEPYDLNGACCARNDFSRSDQGEDCGHEHHGGNVGAIEDEIKHGDAAVVTIAEATGLGSRQSGLL